MNVIMFHNIVEENGKTIKDNNMEKKHKYNIGDKVFLCNFTYGNFNSEQMFAGIVEIYSLDRDCDGTPIYSVTPYGNNVIESMKECTTYLNNNINLSMNHWIMGGLSESSLMGISNYNDIKIIHGQTFHEFTRKDFNKMLKDYFKFVGINLFEGKEEE